MHFYYSSTRNCDHHILLIMPGNAHKRSCNKLLLILVREQGLYTIKTDCSGKMVVAFTISIRKISCLMVYITAPLAEIPSVTLGLRVSVHPAKPALPIRMKSYQTPICFLHIRCSRLFVFLFLIEYLISRSWLCLRSMCSVHC